MVALDRKICFFVMQTQMRNGQYVALIAEEGNTGYFVTDWLWGKDFEVAERIAAERNEKIGIDKTEAWKIVAGTMRGGR